MPASLRIEIFPTDMDRSVKFYSEVLHFTVLRHTPSYAYLQRDGIFIGADAHPASARIAAKADYRRPPTGVEVVIEVDDVKRERDLVVKAGWPLDEDVKMQFWGLRDFRVEDPDGYYLRITEYGAKGLEEDDEGEREASKGAEIC